MADEEQIDDEGVAEEDGHLRDQTRPIYVPQQPGATRSQGLALTGGWVGTLLTQNLFNLPHRSQPASIGKTLVSTYYVRVLLFRLDDEGGSHSQAIEQSRLLAV